MLRLLSGAVAAAIPSKHQTATTGRRRSWTGLFVFTAAAALLGATPAIAETEFAVDSGLKPIDRSALQALVSETARKLHVPGAFVLLRTPQGELSAAYGTTRLGAMIRPREGTHFRIASITKTMTAAVILQLAQEGRLRLADPVSMYIAGVPDGDHITIGQLLRMRSGLYNYTNDPRIAKSIDDDPTRVWTPRQLLQIAFAHPRNFPPGQANEYSNTNYVLLGLIAEKVDGRPLATAMRKRLFQPLGLQDTHLPAATSNSIPAPFAHGYLYGSSSVALVGTPAYTEAFKAAVEAGRIQPKDYTGVNHSFARAAGGVISTARDLDIWIRALVGGRVLDAKHQQIWRDSPRQEKPDNPYNWYGFGISQLRWGPNVAFLHGGETPGYNSEALHDPGNKVTLVVWTNLTVWPADKPTALTFMLNILDRIYKSSPLKPRPPARVAH